MAFWKCHFICPTQGDLSFYKGNPYEMGATQVPGKITRGILRVADGF